MRKLFRDRWNKEEIKLVLVLAIALMVSALLFYFSTSRPMPKPAEKFNGEAFMHDYNW